MAGHATETSDGFRTFVWFTPEKRKPTEYESYTVGQQSGPSSGWTWTGRCVSMTAARPGTTRPAQ